MQQTISASNFADIMGVSKATLQKWESNGTFVPSVDKEGHKYFFVDKLLHVPEINDMVHSAWEEEMQIRPLRPYISIELFAGAGGLALGMEKAGFSHILLNEIDHDACVTLQYNRPKWRVAEQDVRTISFKQFNGQVDFLSGGDTLRDADIAAYASGRLDMLEGYTAEVEARFRDIFDKCGKEGFVMPPMHSPLRGFSYAQTGASVGPKINPFYKVSVEHHGLDMIVHQDTPVFSAGKGVVTGVQRSGRGLGNVVEITHDGGYVTRYAHLDKITVARGRKVDEETVIGHVGTSGMTIAPHLHYEVIKDGKVLDPVNYFFGDLDPYSYADILIMSVTTGQSMD